MRNFRNVRFLKPEEKLGERATTGISLHCHTRHSKELLDFVPYYAERIPIVSHLWRRELRKCLKMYGRPPEFKTGYWTPPLTGRQVFDMESDELESLGLESIVSITDHDSIDANLELHDELEDGSAPISMEWTVPFDIGFFHIGVHNLPRDRARMISDELIAYSNAVGEPNDVRLHELFALLNDCPDVLIVLNHPIWDIEMIGQQLHEKALDRFLASHAKWIHAVEINGFRSWSENEAAADLAEKLGVPIISGGDRHCMHSNTMINVSNAKTFSEFVNEVRCDGHSSLAVRSEYSVPLPARQVASIAQILGNFEHFPEGRRLWSDRIYFNANDGSGLKTLTEHWDGQFPLWIRAALVALSVISHPLMRPIIGMSVGDKDIGRDEGNIGQSLVKGTSITPARMRTE